MRQETIRGVGLVVAIAYGAFTVWLYVRQPQTIADVTGGLSASVGAYRINRQAFDDGVTFFHRDQFDSARTAFERADPAGLDARTQFYLAYSYYREGWGRLYHDNTLYTRGIAHVNKAIEAAPGGRVIVNDPNLQMQSADELKAELEAGLQSDVSDLNPMKLWRQRK